MVTEKYISLFFIDIKTFNFSLDLLFWTLTLLKFINYNVMKLTN